MSIESFRARLKSGGTNDRIKAVGALDVHQTDHLPLLLSALNDRSPYVCALAAAKLAEAPPESAAQPILSRFLSLDVGGAKCDPGCHIRAALAMALGRLAYHPAADGLRSGIKTVQVEAVAGVLTDTAVALRGNCALALSQLWTPETVRDLGILLFDTGTVATTDTLTARKAAARALGLLGDPAGLTPLAIRLAFPQNEVPEVLAECMEAVVALEDSRAMELFAPYLESHDMGLVAQAALMTARLGRPEAPELLTRLCTRMSGDALRAVVLALASMRSDDAVAALRSLARHERDEIRLAAIEALAGSRDEPTASLLAELARADDSPAVRAAAARAME